MLFLLLDCVDEETRKKLRILMTPGFHPPTYRQINYDFEEDYCTMMRQAPEHQERVT